MRFDRFVDIRDPVDLQRLEYDTDIAIHSLDDLVQALETDMALKVADGMVAIKIALAYRRTIDFGEPVTLRGGASIPQPVVQASKSKDILGGSQTPARLRDAPDRSPRSRIQPAHTGPYRTAWGQREYPHQQ